MPIRINTDLPAKKILEHENIFVMDNERSLRQNYYHESDAYKAGNRASTVTESF